MVESFQNRGDFVGGMALQFAKLGFDEPDLFFHKQVAGRITAFAVKFNCRWKQNKIKRLAATSEIINHSVIVKKAKHSVNNIQIIVPQFFFNQRIKIRRRFIDREMTNEQFEKPVFEFGRNVRPAGIVVDVFHDNAFFTTKITKS